MRKYLTSIGAALLLLSMGSDSSYSTISPISRQSNSPEVSYQFLDENTLIFEFDAQIILRKQREGIEKIIQTD